MALRVNIILSFGDLFSVRANYSLVFQTNHIIPSVYLLYTILSS